MLVLDGVLALAPSTLDRLQFVKCKLKSCLGIETLLESCPS